MNEVVKLIRGLVSAKVRGAHPSPGRAYFFIYCELRQIERESNYLLMWMRRWIDEYGQHSDPLYHEVYGTLGAIAQSLIRLKELMRRELDLALSVFDEDLRRKLREVVGLKFVRLELWISFFECKKLAQKKMLLRFTKVKKDIRTSHENVARADHFLWDVDAKRIKRLRKRLHDLYGAETEQVSVEDFEKLEVMIRNGRKAVRKLHEALDELSRFIRENFKVSDLLEDRQGYIFGESD